MTARNEASHYRPIPMDDQYFEHIFSYVEQHKNYRPHPGELDQFFNSRIWKVIEEGMKMRLAAMMNAVVDPTLTKESHVALCAGISSIRWMLNLRENLFEARRRAEPTPKNQGE